MTLSILCYAPKRMVYYHLHAHYPKQVTQKVRSFGHVSIHLRSGKQIAYDVYMRLYVLDSIPRAFSENGQNICRIISNLMSC